MPACPNKLKGYSRRFLQWAGHFERSISGAPFTEAGLAQFDAMESRGERPVQPDPYFVRLDAGRAMFNALQKEVRASYLTPAWQGYAADLDLMPAWLFRAMYGWHPEAIAACEAKAAFSSSS